MFTQIYNVTNTSEYIDLSILSFLALFPEIKIPDFDIITNQFLRMRWDNAKNWGLCQRIMQPQVYLISWTLLLTWVYLIEAWISN